MNYQVTLTSEARLQLEKATDWYASRDHDVAEKWITGFELALKTIAENPRLFSLAREDSLVDAEIRQLHYGSGRRKTHRAVFRIDEDSKQVEVIAIRHFAQDDLTKSELSSE